MKAPLLFHNGKIEVLAMDRDNQTLYITIHFTPDTYDEATKEPGLIVEQISTTQEYMRKEGFMPINDPDWRVHAGMILHKPQEI